MYPGIPSIRAGIKHGNEQKIDRRHPGNAQNIPGEASNSAHPNSAILDLLPWCSPANHSGLSSLGLGFESRREHLKIGSKLGHSFL